MSNLNDTAVKLGIDPSSYNDSDESQARLKERVETRQKELDSFDNEEARGGDIPETVVSKESVNPPKGDSGKAQSKNQK